MLVLSHLKCVALYYVGYAYASAAVAVFWPTDAPALARVPGVCRWRDCSQDVAQSNFSS